MKNILIVAHQPSKNTVRLADSVLRVLYSEDLQINIMAKKPFETTSDDVLNTDALIIITTENLGYMAGLTKDFFDRCYYRVLDKKQGLPVVVIIRAGHDGTGTKKSLEPIFIGLRWQLVQPMLILRGEWHEQFIKQAQELVLTLAYGVEAGIY